MTEQQKISALADQITQQTLVNLENDPNVNLTNATATEIKGDVKKEVSAVIMNQLNQEPWYQSRIIIAQTVTLVAAVAGILGYSIAPELREQIIVAVLAVGALVNPLVTLWARTKAAKPLGQ